MTSLEYERLQEELSQLLKSERYKWMTSREKDGFEKGVLACKSVLHSYHKYHKACESKNGNKV